MTDIRIERELLDRLLPAVMPGAAVAADAKPFTGGLESAVALLPIVQDGRRRVVVVKRLAGPTRREAAHYRMLAGAGVTPALLGAVEQDDHTYLFLERVRPSVNWPWRDSAKTRLVLDRLAHIHRLRLDTAPLDDWAYEDELRASADETLRVACDLASAVPEIGCRRDLGPLRRVVRKLDAARERMFAALGTTLIHGDVHSGNVVLRGRGEREHVVFLDWGRSRRGSPFEDVSSWLVSLRTWEPAAMRDHDSLLRAYLEALGADATLTPDVRDAYWTAAAGNALAGALRYQLYVAADSAGAMRATAARQARAALRIIRLLDERLRRA